jgi:hypothetical protein
MPLADWSSKGWIRSHRTSPEEIQELLAIADRDLSDSASPGLSPDWRLNIAYNAALQLATAALAASGYRTAGEGHHYRTIQSLVFTIGSDRELVRQFDTFRKKRNISGYERVGAVSDQEAKDMAALARRLKEAVERWLCAHHPELG